MSAALRVERVVSISVDNGFIVTTDAGTVTLSGEALHQIVAFLDGHCVRCGAHLQNSEWETTHDRNRGIRCACCGHPDDMCECPPVSALNPCDCRECTKERWSKGGAA